METTLFSTSYFPPILWFAYFLDATKILIELHETYPKQTYRNRCHLYSPNGLFALSIPIVKAFGNATKTHEVLLDSSQNWKQQHWRSIKTFYSKTPYFIHYAADFEQLFANHKPQTLVEFNDKILRLILKILKFPAKNYAYTSYFEHHPHDRLDLRNSIHPKKENLIHFPRYIQTFEPKYGFFPNLSILDLLFNQGVSSADYLKSLLIK